MTRQDDGPSLATARWGWRYHHTGVPTQQRKPGERYLPQLKMYVSGFPNSPYGVEFMRFEEDSPIPELSPPGSPSCGVRAAMIVDNGCPIELIEFSRK